MRRNVLAFLVAVLVSLPDPWSVAQARPPTFDAEYRAALRSYNERAYDQAIAHFQAAYQLRPDVRLLLNIGNAHLMLGHATEALRVYEQCAHHRPPLDEAGRRTLAENQRLAQQLLAGSRPAEANQAPPPTPTNQTETARVPAARPPAGVVDAGSGARDGLSLARSPEKPIWKRPWFQGTLGVVGVVVAAGIVTGVVLSTRPGAVPTEDLSDVYDVTVGELR